MIIVIGSPSVALGEPGQPSHATGRSVDVARGAIDGGATVELVGKIGDDPAGDGLMLALADLGIGHAAVLRDHARPTPFVPLTAAGDLDDLLGEDDAPVLPADPGGARPTVDAGDLDLALRYLSDHAVVVVAEPLDADALAVVRADAGYADAHLVLIIEPGWPVDPVSDGLTVLEAPDADPDGIFGRTVGRFAAALDQGRPGAEALEQATAGAGWQVSAG
jgi:sugar/nucleoside kinase (ribokinase family)